MAEFSPEQLEQLANSLKNSREATDDLAKAEKDAEAQVKKNIAALKEFQGYMKNFGSVMTSADHGTAKYGSVVTGATDAMGNLLMKLGPLGIAAGLLAKAFGGLAAASLKQNEALVKSYRSLSEIGAIDSSGVEGLIQNLYKVGATAEDLDSFQRVVKSIAPDLAIMGGTVAKGMNTISNMSQTILDDRTLTRSLKNFGYTTEQIMETGSRYVATQSRNGSMQGKSTAELAKGAGDYMKVLAELTMITGASRDEGQKALEAQQLDVRWRAYTATLSEKERERANTAMVALTLQNKNAAATIKDQIITNGAVTTRETAQFAGYMGQSYRQVQALIKGTGDVSLGTLSIMKDNAPNLKRALDTFGTAIIYGGKDAAAALNISAEEYDTLQRLQNTNVEEFRKQVEAIAKKQDGRIASQSKLEEKEIQNAQAMDRLKFTVGNSVVPAMESLADVVNKVGSGLAEFTKFITFGAVDMTDMFKSFNTMNDVTTTINAEEKKQIALKEKIRKEDEFIVKAQARLKKDAEEGRTGANTNSVKRNLALTQKNKSSLTEDLSRSQSLTARAQAAGASITSRNREEKASEMQKTAESGDVDLDKIFKFTANSGDRAHFDQLDGRFKQKLIQAATDYFNTTGNKLQVNSSMRTLDEQQRLYDTWLAGGKKGTPVAPPGSSRHQIGQSVDLQNYDDKRAIDALSKAGLVNGRVEKDPQHFEQALNGGIFSGPKTGYPVTLHGKEAVLPMKTLDNLITKLPLVGSAVGNAANTKDPSSYTSDNLIELLIDKLEQMINYQRDTANTSEKILRHSKI